MIISQAWINNYLQKSLSTAQLIKAFNALGFEVENAFHLQNKGLKIAQIKTVTKVVSADRLSLLTVCDLAGHNFEVICGAENVKVGLWGLYAPVGSTIADGTVIKQKSIKKVVSAGMMCSLSEIGIAHQAQTKKQQEDILELDYEQDVAPYQAIDNVVELWHLDTTVFELDLAFNRGDCWGAQQLLKELACFLKITLPKRTLPQLKLVNQKATLHISEPLQGIVQNISYLKVVNHITTYEKQFKHNFFWHLNLVKIYSDNILRTVLEKSIFLSGQALFAIAAKKQQETLTFLLDQEQIVCQTSIEKLKLGSIGEQAFKPDQFCFVVAFNIDFDAMREQLKKQKNNNYFISTRSIRPLSPLYCNEALHIFAQQLLLLQKSLADKIIFTNQLKPIPQVREIEVNLAKLNQFLSLNFTSESLTKLLKQNDIIIYPKTQNSLICQVSAKRFDLQKPQDLYEEVARLWGYDSIPEEPWFNHHLTLPQLNEEVLAEKLLSVLIDQGFQEVKAYNLVSHQEACSYNLYHATKLTAMHNHLSQNHMYLQTSLLPGLVTTQNYNVDHKINVSNLVRIGKIYLNDHYTELNWSIALLIKPEPILDKSEQKWGSFYDLKHCVNQLLALCGIKPFKVDFKPFQADGFHPYQSFKIYYQKVLLGFIGFKLKEEVMAQQTKNYYVAELLIKPLIKKLQAQDLKIKPSSKYHSSKRDFSVIVNTNKYQYQEMLNLALEGVAFIENVQFLYEYQEEKAPDFEKIMTFRVFFNNYQKQLQEQDVQIEEQKILNNFKAHKFMLH